MKKDRDRWIIFAGAARRDGNLEKAKVFFEIAEKLNNIIHPLN